MSDTLTRAKVAAQIEGFASNKLSAKTLAAWAFDQICDREEELLAFESGYTRTIAAVLDDLMWADDANFRIDTATAQQLMTRLVQAQPEPQAEVESTDDSTSDDW